ncbi:Alpha/Beta hydrolase protein [Trametes polyzona]|nr:Alpha/Beta hydrolase protein [Trametes polyzona]
MSTPHTETAAPLYPTEAKEELLALPDGRTLAYEYSGPLDSDLVFIWYHGLFSVGDASNPPPPLQQRRALYVAPTLPGWGNTSPLRAGASYAETVVADTLALLRHLLPAYDPDADAAPAQPEPNLRIYIAGGSFGTVPAQMVFGAPYDRFPYGRYVRGMLLLGAFSPFREHVGYARGLNTRDWLGVGPLTQLLPGRILQRVVSMAIQGKVRDVESAEAFVRGQYFENMDEAEKERYAKWRARRGVEEGVFERRMARGMVRSVATSWEGFLGTADAIHSDWGFRISELDEEHGRKRVVLGLGKSDTSLVGLTQYLCAQYRNAQLREYEGGHLSAAWSMDDLLEDVLDCL